jgi:transcriptional regulator with XRE-family HTH domain
MTTGIGDTLRQARKRAGWSIPDVAAATKMRESLVVAIEEERFEALGGSVYARGFIRLYARAVRMDPVPLIARFDEANAEPDERRPRGREPRRGLAGLASPRQRRRFPVTLVWALLAVAVLWWIGSGDDPSGTGRVAGPTAPATSAPLTPAPTTAPRVTGAGPSPAETDVSTPSPAPTPAAPVEVAIEIVDGPSWLRVTVDDEVVLEGEVPAGSRHDFGAETTIVVRAGFASRVLVTHDGDEQGPMGGPGEVVETTYAADPASG